MHLTIMFNPILRRYSRVLPAILAMAAAFIAGRAVWAQPTGVNPTMITLSAVVTNGNVTISWPVIPGRWELAEQQPAMSGDWTAVPSDRYQTNGTTISVNLPLPKQTALYQVRRSFALHPPPLKNLPPVPPPPTNRPPRLPGHP